MPDPTPLPITADDIVDTVRESLLVLDADLRVRRANRSFYRTFKVAPEDTEGRLVYELGNRQWDIPALRSLLEEILPKNTAFDDFEVEHRFESIGRKVMLLNARRVYRHGNHTESILLAVEDITERRRLEGERAELETRFTSLVKNIRDHSIFTLDPQGHVTSWNTEAEKILGYSEAEALGRHFSMIFTPEDREAGVPALELATAMSEGRAEDERWHLRKTGERFWALGIVTPTTDASGAHTGYSKILRDMTDRKRAEEAMQASEERFRRLSESGFVSIAFFTPDGRITDANDAFLRLTGHDRDDLTAGRVRWDRLTPPEWLPRTRQAVREFEATGRISPYEKEYFRSDGTRFWGLFGGAKLEGRSEGVAFVLDITERKRAEEAVRHSEERFRSLMEQAPFSIQMFAPDGRTIRVNRAWEELWGLTLKQIADYNVLLDPQLEQKGIAPYLRRAFAGEPVELPAIGYDPDETIPNRTRHPDPVRWVSAVAYPLKDDAGRVWEVVLIHQDITARRRADDELREADRRKDEFLATLAHELRNPLAPIRNGLQIMKLAGGDPRATERSRVMMERQVEQMARLIDDLMDVSRISRGKVALQTTRMRLAQAVGDAIETSRPLIERQGHELVLAVPDEPIFVDADHTRLTQVFANLLNNAAKYTEPGGRIRLAVVRQGGDVVVSVEDTGVGIPAHMLTRVFDMFSQVDRSLEKAQGGLGIGLHIVKRLVEMHGGTITAESGGHGRGSRFAVRLPVVLSLTPDPPGDGDGAKATPAARRRILVVDDNRDGATSLAEMLAVMGNETQTAHDGLEAVAVAEAFRPDVILLDIGMPKLNGYDACRRIRQQPWGKAVVIVAQTGWGQDDDKRKSQEAGFDFHMVKPVDPAALERLLAEMRVATG